MNSVCPKPWASSLAQHRHWTDTDIDRLQARITELEQQNLDLRLRLKEKNEELSMELSTARAANRELTKTIDQEPGRTS